MSEERAEGFWWVRSIGAETWSIVWLGSGFLTMTGSTHLWSADEDKYEWGPYLGKQPGDQAAHGAMEDWLEAHGICKLCWTPGLPCQCWNDE